VGTPCCQAAAGTGAGVEDGRNLAAVLRAYGEEYCRSHALPAAHRKVLSAIEHCRMAVLGGHLDQCDQCGHERVLWNSCNDPHCPTCGALKRERWLEARRAELLPVPYFHVVFTLDHGLNFLVGYNPKLIPDLLFAAATETLQQFARKRGGTIGITAVLHTWDQKLNRHLHLHCLVPGGMLALDGSRWIPTRPDFLFSVRALSLVFREKFLDGLGRADAEGKLQWPEAIPSRASSQSDLATLVPRLRRRRWVVYCKPPVAGPDQVLQYLSRYVYRVAIANSRIVGYADGKVTFTYKDRKHDNVTDTLTLPADEFIDRFLLHVLPSGTRRIRHYGLLANRTKKQHLARCRELLGVAPLPPADEQSARDLMLRLTGNDISLCPCCRKGHLRTVRSIEPLYFLDQISPEGIDSS
jgi:hypothetical protein